MVPADHRLIVGVASQVAAGDVICRQSRAVFRWEEGEDLGSDGTDAVLGNNVTRERIAPVTGRRTRLGSRSAGMSRQRVIDRHSILAEMLPVADRHGRGAGGYREWRDLPPTLETEENEIPVLANWAADNAA